MVFHQHCLQLKLSKMGLLEVTGVHFDVCDTALFLEANSVRFGAVLVMSGVTGDGDEIPMTTVVRTVEYLHNGGMVYIWIVYTRQESVGVLRVTGSLLLLVIAYCRAVLC